MKRFFVSLVLLLSVTGHTAERPERCYRYDVTGLHATSALDAYLSDGEEGNNTYPRTLDWMILALHPSTEPAVESYAYLHVMAEGYGYSAYLGKNRKSADPVHYSADCDHGGIELRSDGSLSIGKLDMLGHLTCATSGTGMEDDLYLHDIDWLRAKPVPCDSWSFRHERKRPRPIERKLHVCYTAKTTGSSPRYSGCFRSNTPCTQLGKKRFGHYPDFCEATRAMFRCRDSKPRDNTP